MKNTLKRFKQKYLTLTTLKAVLSLVYIGLNIGTLFVPMDNLFKVVALVGFYLLYLTVTGIIKEVEDEKSKIPVLKQRFTKKAENGSIVIDEKRFREAILYLYEIEDKIYK